jgi:hypothetical protein
MQWCVVTSLFSLCLAWNTLCTAGHSQEHLAYLGTTSERLITCIAGHSSHDLQEAIQLAPCTLLYTFASWSGHARHLIYDRAQLQDMARQYRQAIESKRLAIVAAQINEPPEEGAEQWKYIGDGSYWGSFAMFSNSSVESKVVVVPAGKQITQAIDACLTRSNHGNHSAPLSGSTTPKDEL